MRPFARFFRREDSPDPAPLLTAKQWAVFTCDLLLILLILLAFSWFHHGRITTEDGEGILSCRSGTIRTWSGDPDEADDGGGEGWFSFPKRFWQKKPIVRTEGDTAWYLSDRIEIGFTSYYNVNGCDAITVADVYLKEITSLTTRLARDTYGKGQRAIPSQIARGTDAVLRLTGDNYSFREDTAVLRNGIMYSRGKKENEVCVLYWTGEMEFYPAGTYDAAAVTENAPYQIWSSGPVLLDEEGKPRELTPLLTDLNRRRLAVGYYEPGHYCFVLMDGDVSSRTLAETMQSLGCKGAYELCSGRSCSMALSLGDSVLSTTDREVAACSDIIMVRN